MNETRDVPICGCTGEQLERGDSCGQANCPNNQPAQRYFADRFDADGKFYVFDGEQEGSECGGPFDTLAEARVKAEELNARGPLWGIEAEVQVRGRDAADAYRNAQALSDAVARMDCGAVYVVEGDAQRIAEPERVI